MGIWLSHQRFVYMHATQDNLESAGTAIAPEKGMYSVIRLEPVSGYAGYGLERGPKISAKDGEDATGLPTLP